MEFGVYAVLAIAVLVAVSIFSKRLGVAAPIILVVVGVTLSYLPGVPIVEVPPELVLDVVLPPILYAAALTLPVIDFRRNLGTISSLSVVLVLVSAFATGFLLYVLLPDLNLAAAIALGAVISPPDAVAATSVGRRLGLPPRLVTVLEGEGLVNDATALVLLRSASAVAAGALLTPGEAIGDFVRAVVLAIIVGLAVGFLTVFVRSKLDDPVLDVAVSIVVPFIAFLPTEQIEASGVLAVVVAGLYTGHMAPRRFSAQARASDRINWRTIQFLLENGVFLLIGLEIRGLVQAVDADILSLPATIGIGLLATLALILIRFVWMVPVVASLKRSVARAEQRTAIVSDRMRAFMRMKPRDERMARRMERAQQDFDRRLTDVEYQRREGISRRGGIVLAWSGMRGVVTLAAAQSLPESTPYRPQLVLIAYTVAVTTLVLQGGTLPALIRALGIRGADPGADQRELAKLLDDIGYAGLAVLEDPAKSIDFEGEIDPDVVERARQSSFLRSESAWEGAKASGGDREETPHYVYRRLRLAVVEAEKRRLLEARSSGAYSSRVLSRAQTMLDLEETRLRPPRTDH